MTEPETIRRTLAAYGSAFLYDGELLDPTRVTVHHYEPPNRWAAFTLDELERRRGYNPILQIKGTSDQPA
jgi:hypothetical protein